MSKYTIEIREDDKLKEDWYVWKQFGRTSESKPSFSRHGAYNTKDLILHFTVDGIPCKK